MGTSVRAPDELLLELYAAAGDQERWRASLGALGNHFSAAAVSLYTLDLRWCHGHTSDARLGSAARVAVGFDPDFVAPYFEHFVRKNPWYLQDGAHLGSGQAFLSQALVPDRTLERHEFQADFLRRQRLFHNMTAVLERRGTELFCVTVQRGPRNRGPFEDQDLAGLAGLVPHLQQAARLHQHILTLQLREVAWRRSLDAVRAPVALLDVEMRLLAASDAAFEALGSPHGAITLGASGRVSARDPWTDARLRRAVELACRTPGQESVLRPSVRTGAPRLALTVLPLGPDRARRAGGKPCALVSFAPAAEARTVPSEAALAAAFGLTPAEARLGAHLLEGLTPVRIAQLQRVSVNTIKTHLKRLLEKAGVSRQADFVRVALTSLPASLPEVGPTDLTRTGDDPDRAGS